MSDYFAALALRTLRPELGVQPRRRSPFEDAAPRASDEAFAANDEAIAHAARPSDVNERNERVPRSKRRLTAAVDSSVDEPLVQPPVTLRKARSRAVDLGDEVIAVPATHPTVRVAEPMTIVRTKRVERDSHPLVRRAETRSDDHRGPEPLLPRANERSAETSQKSAARVKEAQRSEPTVRIHIGRVDVRAVTSGAPSQPPRRSKATGLMTLDDYIKQRDGDRS